MEKRLLVYEGNVREAREEARAALKAGYVVTLVFVGTGKSIEVERVQELENALAIFEGRALEVV